MSEPVKDTFQKMRAQERAHAPSFDALLARAPRRRAKLDLLPLAGVGIAAALVVMAAWPRHMDVGTMTLSISWRAPTDTLLATPGRDLMRELPNLHASILNFQGSP